MSPGRSQLRTQLVPGLQPLAQARSQSRASLATAIWGHLSSPQALCAQVPILSTDNVSAMGTRTGQNSEQSTQPQPY